MLLQGCDLDLFWEKLRRVSGLTDLLRLTGLQISLIESSHATGGD
jgi:hypothetical protein